MNQIADLHVHLTDNIERTLAMFDSFCEDGVTDINLLALTYMICPHESNFIALYYKQVYRKLNIRVFGSLYYDRYKNYYTMPFEKQAEELLDMGCDGIKLMEEKPNYHRYIGFGIDSKLYDKMFDMLEERGTPIVAHVADPETFWDITKMSRYEIEHGWYFGDGSCLSKREIYDEVFRRLDRNPKLRIVMAHFFFLGFDIDEAERVMDKYPNLGFDLAPGNPMFAGFTQNTDKWHDFFVRHADRIYFGTDCTSRGTTPFSYQHTLRQSIYDVLKHDTDMFKIQIDPYDVRGLALDDATIHKICYENYFAFSGKTPKPLNRLLFEKGTEEVSEKIPEKVRFLERLKEW